VVSHPGVQLNKTPLHKLNTQGEASKKLSLFNQQVVANSLNQITHSMQTNWSAWLAPVMSWSKLDSYNKSAVVSSSTDNLGKQITNKRLHAETHEW